MYETKDRLELLINIKDAIPYIEDEDLKETTTGIILKLVAMKDKEFRTFVVGESYEHTNSVTDMINLAANIDDFIFIPDISDWD